MSEVAEQKGPHRAEEPRSFEEEVWRKLSRIDCSNKVTFVPSLRTWTEQRSVVWKRAPSIERAVNLCYEDGDVPSHWVAQQWSRT